MTVVKVLRTFKFRKIYVKFKTKIVNCGIEIADLVYGK